MVLLYWTPLTTRVSLIMVLPSVSLMTALETSWLERYCMPSSHCMRASSLLVVVLLTPSICAKMASAFASAALAAARSSSMAEAVTMATSADMRRSAASIATRDKAVERCQRIAQWMMYLEQ